jgi:hypothetical protein
VDKFRHYPDFEDPSNDIVAGFQNAVDILMLSFVSNDCVYADGAVFNTW